MPRILGILLLFVFASADAALLGRLPATPAGTDYQAYYDTDLDVTWLADANFAVSAGVGASGGTMTLAVANSWLPTLDIDGITGWRLPSMDVNGDGTVVDCAGGGVTGCADNEMGFLYWEEGISMAASGVFSNVLTNYWSSTAASANTTWRFSFSNGTHSTPVNWDGKHVWAVHDGDIAAPVPVPAAVWLFGSAIGLFGWMRRKTA